MSVPSLKDAPEVDHSGNIKILKQFQLVSGRLTDKIKGLDKKARIHKQTGYALDEKLKSNQEIFETLGEFINEARDVRNDVEASFDSAKAAEKDALVNVGFAPTSIKWIAEHNKEVLRLKKKLGEAKNMVHKFVGYQKSVQNRIDNLKVLIRGNFRGEANY